MVTVISPSNAYVFSDYILSSLEEFALTRNSIVRCTYASCLSHLAVSAARLLDSIQALRADGSVAAVDPQTESSQTPESHYQRLYDAAYSTHVEEFQKHARSFLEDRNSFVRRAFLKSVPALCVFFGSSIANDVLLSHLNTYLNDPDWKLRWVFYETMVAISIILGSSSAQDFILPLMTQGLQSSEEYIIERVIRSLSGMADLGFLHRAQLWKMAEGLSRFLIHPSVWIRDATATFIAASTRYLPTSDIHCILGPIIYPYLRNLILQYDLLSILGTLKKPLARPSYEMAVYWSMSYSKGVFWLSVKAGRTSTQSDGKTARNHSDPSHLLFNKVKRNAEDEQWISKLRDTGLSREDEWKILVLREQIWYGGRASPSATPPNSKIKLATTGVQIHIVMWNDIKDYTTTQSDVASNVNAREGRSASLADALLEASTTIDLPSTRQQRLVDSSRGSRDSSLTRRRPQAQNIDSIVGASFTPSPLSSTPLSNSSDTITDAKYRQGRTARPTNTNGTKLRVPDGLSHRGSAIELLGTNGGAKSSAEPAITAAKAEGKMGSQGYQPPSDANELLSTQDRNSRPISHSAVHTYEGDDPDILHLLEDMYIDKHPSDVPEFGANPQISRRRPIKNNAHRAGEKPWHPDGTLIALFTEHIGSINRVLVAPDSEFFLTASDDGTVKVWDSSRLERNISNRSRQTWRHPRNSPIKALCFIEHSHTFVAGAADGSIHVVRVDHNTNSGMGRYGKLRQLKHAQLIEGEKALWIEHHQFDGRSTLFVATNQCHIVALDTKSMTELFALDNPVHHGIPTSFCLDRRRTWLVIGTSHGILDQWDLRFRLLIRSWGIGGTSPIHRVCLHPLKARSTNYRKRIYVAGGSAPDEITVWDVEKAECKEVYRVGALPADQPRRVRDQPVQGENEVPSTRLYEPWFLDEGSKRNPEAMLKLFGTALDPTDAAASPDRGIRAMAVGIDIGDGGIDAEYPFMLTGNSDRKVRFWDLSRVEGSRVVWGQSAGAAKPAFRSETPLVRVPNLVAHYEVAASPDKAKGTITGAGKETPSIGKREAQRSLEDHVDVIMDVAVLQKPYGMVVTVDRAGIIRVFS